MNTIKNIAVNHLWISAGAVFCLNFLVACSALPTPPAQPVSYDFGPGAFTAVAAPATNSASRAPLLVTDVESTGVAEGSTSLNYRLAYDQAQQLRAYQQARWSQPPAQLVQQALLEELAQHRPVLSSGAARAAVRTNSGGTSNGGTSAPGISDRAPAQASTLVLRLDLQEFSQVFTSPTQSAGVLRLRATLAEPRPQGEVLLGQRTFNVKTPAPSADAAGGSAALAQASAQVARELAVWVDQASR